MTKLVHDGVLSEIQAPLYACLKFKESVWILFDNIDKGWPAHGLGPTDIVVVRALQEAARKVGRSLEQRKISTHAVVFLRNDVFELLVSESPDRGKEARVLLDWSDRDALGELVRRRLTYAGLQGSDLAEMWNQICVPIVRGKPSFDFLLDHCLMRPRFLLDLINHCKGSAVNVGHSRMEEADLIKGVKIFSSDLVMDISFEIADVLGHAAAGKILMKLVGCDQIVSDVELTSLLLDPNAGDHARNELMKILLWHGVIGLSSQNGEEATYIYQFNYNFSLMEAAIEKAAALNGHPYFRINDAFIAGLQLATLH